MECLIGSVLGSVTLWCLATVGYLWMECRQPGVGRTRLEPAEPLWGGDQSTEGDVSRRGSDDDPGSCLVAIDKGSTEEPSVLL